MLKAQMAEAGDTFEVQEVAGSELLVVTSQSRALQWIPPVAVPFAARAAGVVSSAAKSLRGRPG